EILFRAAWRGELELWIDRNSQASVLVVVEIELQSEDSTAHADFVRVSAGTRGRDGNLELQLRRQLVPEALQHHAVVGVDAQHLDLPQIAGQVGRGQQIELELSLVGHARIVDVERRRLRSRIDDFDLVVI